MNPAELHEDGDDPRKSATEEESGKVHSYECLDAFEPVLGGELSIRCPQVPQRQGPTQPTAVPLCLRGRHPPCAVGNAPHRHKRHRGRCEGPHEQIARPTGDFGNGPRLADAQGDGRNHEKEADLQHFESLSAMVTSASTHTPHQLAIARGLTLRAPMISRAGLRLPLQLIRRGASDRVLLAWQHHARKYAREQNKQYRHTLSCDLALRDDAQRQIEV